MVTRSSETFTDSWRCVRNSSKRADCESAGGKRSVAAVDLVVVSDRRSTGNASRRDNESCYACTRPGGYPRGGSVRRARASSVNLRLGVAGEPLIAREIYDFRQLRGRFAYRAPSRKPSCTRERSASSHHRRFDRLVLRTCSSCSSRRSPLESTVDFADLLPTRYSGELIELSRRERGE